MLTQPGCRQMYAERADNAGDLRLLVRSSVCSSGDIREHWPQSSVRGPSRDYPMMNTATIADWRGASVSRKKAIPSSIA
jgi:hypothetical protein